MKEINKKLEEKITLVKKEIDESTMNRDIKTVSTKTGI